jgi:hypothetical protein
MIEYDVHKNFGMSVLIQMSGSVLPQALLPSCLSMVVAALVLIEVYEDPNSSPPPPPPLGTNSSSPPIEVFRQFLRHPYPHQITSVMIGFMMVFRVQLSYNRYWEGIGVLTSMFTKWHDAAVQLVAFDELSKGEAERNGGAFRTHALHLFSFMSMCSLLELKREDLAILSLTKREEKPLQLPILRRVFGLEPPEPDYAGRDRIDVLGGLLDGELAHLQVRMRGSTMRLEPATGRVLCGDRCCSWAATPSDCRIAADAASSSRPPPVPRAALRRLRHGPPRASHLGNASTARRLRRTAGRPPPQLVLPIRSPPSSLLAATLAGPSEGGRAQHAAAHRLAYLPGAL